MTSRQWCPTNGSSLHRRVRRQRPRHHRAQAVRGAVGTSGAARSADRSRQSTTDLRPGRPDAGPCPADGRLGRRLFHRPRQLQGRQRIAGAPGRRSPAQGGSGAIARPAQGQRQAWDASEETSSSSCKGTSLAAGPELVAERIREALRVRFRVQGFEGVPITVTASVASRWAIELQRRTCCATRTSLSTGPRPKVGTGSSSSSRRCSPQPRDRLELRTDLDVGPERRVLPPLPADLRSRELSHSRHGSAPALEVPDQGNHPARHVHPGPRGQSEDRRRRALGPFPGVPSSGHLARSGVSDDGVGQRLHATARSGRS